MLSRRSLMVLSFIISAVLYICFFAAAPYVTLMAANRDLDRALDIFKVEIREVEPEVVKVETPEAAEELASRPGSMSDLLARPDEQAQLPAPATAAQPVEVPNLSDRVASEALAREHDLAYEPATANTADAKIIEIARDTARQDIEVPRRFVRPSPERILGPGEYPSLRSEAMEPGQIPMEFDRRGVSLLAQSANLPAGGAPGPPIAEIPVPEPEIPPDIREAIEKPPVEAPLQKEVEAARSESDFVFMDDMVDIKISTYRAPNEKQGYFELRIQPREGGKMEVLPKDITFVLDASRSMLQRKLDLGARGVSDLVNLLRPEDRFNVVVFRDTPILFQPERVPATNETKAAALDFMKNLESKGQTDVYNALRPVMAELPRPGVPGIVLVVSDGRPTTGLQDSRAIITALTAENSLRNSIFAYGAGNTVNRYMLDLLAYRNKGVSRVHPNIEDTAKLMPGFFGEFSDPILVDVRADYGRINKDTLFPRILPDFYRKGAVAVYGRFDPERDKEFVMRLTGRAADREKELVFKAKLESAGQGGSSIASGWAFSKAYHLIGEISQQGETPELLGQLRELSEKYNIRTTYNQ